MLGAANGSRNSTTGQETHPRTGKKMRKASIVDIKGKENTIVKDPYGVEHTLPEKPTSKIICNVTSKPENDPENIKKLLVEQICSTVRWRESLINMHNEKIDNFIEIGPGKVLSGMVKRTLKNINIFSINSIDDMKKVIYEFKK